MKVASLPQTPAIMGAAAARAVILRKDIFVSNISTTRREPNASHRALRSTVLCRHGAHTHATSLAQFEFSRPGEARMYHGPAS